jgi:ribosomal protein L7/L12
MNDKQLEALQARVALLEGQMQAILEHLGVTGQVDEGLRGEILELIRSRQQIAAIKLYRERTGVGLVEAKRVVEDIERGSS